MSIKCIIDTKNSISEGFKGLGKGQQQNSTVGKKGTIFSARWMSSQHSLSYLIVKHWQKDYWKHHWICSELLGTFD